MNILVRHPVGVIRTKLLDPDGTLVEEREMPMHSWTFNFLLAWKYAMTRVSETNAATTTAGGSFTLARSYWFGSAGFLKGIVAGTGNTASDFDDIALETPIAHGNGAGQLDYSTHAHSAVGTSPSDGEIVSTYERTLTNNSGGTITVRELGLIGATNSGTGDLTNAHLLERDVLDTPAAINNGQIYIVSFEWHWNDTAATIINYNGAYACRLLPTISNPGLDLPNVEGGNSATADEQFRVAGGADQVSGIRLGTGTTVFDPDTDTQSELDTEIANGTGAGQLEWEATTIGDVEYDATDGSFVVERQFLNQSGGSIGVEEVGLYSYVNNDPADETDIIMTMRAVLGETYTMANNTGHTASITFLVEHSPPTS